MGGYGAVYYDICKLDIKLLEDADGAIELASAHRSYSLPPDCREEGLLGNPRHCFEGEVAL